MTGIQKHQQKVGWDGNNFSFLVSSTHRHRAFVVEEGLSGGIADVSPHFFSSNLQIPVVALVPYQKQGTTDAVLFARFGEPPHLFSVGQKPTAEVVESVLQPAATIAF